MRKTLAVAAIALAWTAPVGARADHDPPHDTRHNPNCAWDSRRSVDSDADGEPDHFVIGLAHNTSFPRQFVEKVWEPLTGQDQLPPFFGRHDAHDQVTIYMQGDHRMFGANPSHDEEGNPEQLHNGAVYATVDYDEVEDGRAPRVEWGAGVYEANHLVMACGASDEDPEAAACLNGMEIYRMTDEECPLD